jgi:hypothetical protein
MATYEIYSDKNNLRFIGMHRLGRFAYYPYYQCVTCGTEYPVIENELQICDGVPAWVPVNEIRCNGKAIEACPYCKIDKAGSDDLSKCQD